MATVVDRLQCGKGVVQIAVRIRVTVTDTAVQRVIGFTFHTQIPLLSHQKLPGLDDGGIIFCITEANMAIMLNAVL